MRQVSLEDCSVSSEILLPGLEFTGPSCLIHTNFLALNEEFGRHHLRDLYVHTQQVISEVRLHKLPAGIKLAVRDAEDFICHFDDWAVTEQIRPDWDDVDVSAAISDAAIEVEVAGDTVLLARYGVRTWGHWLGELLPKAVCVESKYPGRFLYVVPEYVMTDANLRTMRQSLAAYGIGRDRLVLARGGRAYRFTDLHAVSLPWFPDCALHPQVAAHMRRITQNLEYRPSPYPKIALLRRESATRNLRNFEEVCNYLAVREWLIVDISRLDFIDQVSLFAGAANIISVLGSGLTGIIYSPKHVNVLTLAPSQWGDIFFFRLMQERQTRLADIRGVSLGTSFAEAAHLPFTIDLGALEAGMRALGIGTTPIPSVGSQRSHVENRSLYHQLRTAAGFRDRQDFTMAEQLVRQAIFRAPEDLPAHTMLADVLTRQGKIEEALPAAERGLALYPSIELLRLMQDRLTGVGEVAKAIEYSRREVALYPDDAEAFSRLGHVLCRAEQFSEAAECFDRASALRENDLGLQLAFSRALVLAGRLSEAVAALRAVIAAHPEELAAYVDLARVLIDQGEHAPAGDVLGEALKRDPGNEDALQVSATLRSLVAAAEAEGPDALPEVSPAPATEQEIALAEMNHVQFLSLLKRALAPRVYIEVGIGDGTTLFSEPVPEFAIGIDPNPQLTPEAIEQIAKCRQLLLLRATSDDAFAQLSSSNLLDRRPPDMAFIDGLHHCDVVLRDIANCARLCRDGALLVIHDVIPGSEEQTARTPIAGTWMGDVYKILPVIWAHLSEFPAVLVRDVAPSGMLAIISSRVLSDAIFGQYDALVAATSGYSFHGCIDQIIRKGISYTSPEFAAFLERARGRSGAAEAAVTPPIVERATFLARLSAPGDALPPANIAAVHGGIAWYPVEAAGPIRFRWTGAERVEWPVVAEPPQFPCTVKFVIPVAAEISPDYAKRCRLLVASQTYDVEREQGAISATVDLDQPWREPIALLTPPPLRPFDVSGSPDQRPLGLAIPIG